MVGFPVYRLFVLVTASIIIFLLWVFLEKTKYGAIIRAGIENKEMVSALGINIYMLFTLTFGLGALLAGLAGALILPIRGAYPAMGLDILLISFVVTVLGGMGSLVGVLLAGLLVGVVQSLIVLFWPSASMVSVFAVMALGLIVRPQGFFGIR
jgi:branched-chain amino acid transport system permease protein